MPDPHAYIAAKFDVSLAGAKPSTPIELPNVGRDPGLTRMLAYLGCTSGAEIGVERGLFSEALLRENPALHLTCVDAWKAYRGYRDHVDGAKLQSFYIETQERLAQFHTRVTIVRQFSLDAARDVSDGSLDFVYLDANHNIENVIADLAAWTPKVRAGGIIAGHDYVRYRLPNQIHVLQGINAWVDSWEIAPWFLLGRHAKVDGEVRDTARSWFWVHGPKPVHRKGRKPVKQ